MSVGDAPRKENEAYYQIRILAPANALRVQLAPRPRYIKKIQIRADQAR